MFEMARDHARDNTDFEVVGGYLSLVNDAYKKPGLAPSVHRYNMCRLACDKTSDWLMVDPYEARQENYVPTAPVLDHFDDEINKKHKGVPILDASGQEIGRKNVRIILLAGSDLIQTMSEPGVWAEEDVSTPCDCPSI
jgi:nicotinamide mononucleotide adenylyltransferase